MINLIVKAIMDLKLGIPVVYITINKG